MIRKTQKTEEINSDKRIKRGTVRQRMREASRNERKSVFSILFDWFLVIGIAFILGFAVTKYAFFMINVPSGSMTPTIGIGDRIYVRRIYKPENLKRGDIVVFKTTEGQRSKSDPDEQHFVKRLIGLPGEKIKITSGEVWVNGEKLKEDYVVNNKTDYSGEFTVPPDSYFFLGDNRANSFDSRYWKDTFVKAENIRALAGLRVVPLTHMGFLK